MAKNSSDDFDGCGISWLLSTNETDPLTPACKRHDSLYVFSGPGRDPKKRALVDKEFLRDMLAIADHTGSWWLKPRAYLFYGVARLVGGFFWD